MRAFAVIAAAHLLRLGALAFNPATSTPPQVKVRGSIDITEDPRNGDKLPIPHGEDIIAYDVRYGPNEPTLVYLPAFDSPSGDIKASSLKHACLRTGRTYATADWYGVGKSTGNFRAGTISRWYEDTIKLLTTVLGDKRKAVLVGGGVGGWIALLVAKERPDLVAGIVGLAADPDFTENLLWKYLSEETKEEVNTKGVSLITWGGQDYPLTKKFIEDGRNNLVLGGAENELEITCPVRLVHSLQDKEVPYTVSIDLARRLESKDVAVVLEKGSRHHLDGDTSEQLILQAVKHCCDVYNLDKEEA
ncbi:unnamed protein product [Chrysoparadoxa australica]